MERLCFLIELREGGESIYDKLHQNMTDSLRTHLAECGYSNYTIFRSGRTVIGLAECDPDVDSVLTRQLAIRTDEMSGLEAWIAVPLVRATEVWSLQKT